MNLRSGLPSPSGDVVLPSPGANVSGGAPQQGAAPQPSLRDQIKQQWMAAGATPEGAEGIVRWVEERESGLNPRAVGDNGTSFGIYMEHKDRALRLLDRAQRENKIPSDPFLQTALAIDESTKGLDPQATANAASFMKATDPEVAKMAFGKHFERPASLYGMMNTPSGGGVGMAGLAQSEREISQLSERDRAEYERLRNAPDPNAKERSELLIDARERAREAREAYANLASSPPPDKPIGALENFGSFGTMLALLIGGLGRHHMNGALMAAGGMMQAAQSNNHELFERKYKIWDHQTTSALNLAHLEREEIRDLLEDKRMSENERQARLHSFFEEHQMGFQAAQAKAGLWEHVYAAEQAAERAKNGAAMMKLQYGQMMFSNWMTAHPDAKPEEVDAQAAFYGVISGRATAGGGAWSKDSMDALVAMAVRGDPGVMTSLPRSGTARKQFEAAFAAKLKEQPGGIEGGAAEVMMNRLRMAEAKSAATTAGRVTIQTDLYMNEAIGAGKLVLEASKAFPRTDYPRVNDAIIAYEKNTGDPRVIEFGTQINALINAYGKLSNPTGTGVHDADKARMENIMNERLSHGQVEAAIDAVIKDGKNVADAAVKTQLEVLGGLVPKGLGAVDTPSTAPPSAAPAAGQSYGSPDDVYRAFDAGQLTKEQAKQVLIDKFGAKAQ
jgi:hypothetical protein